MRRLPLSMLALSLFVAASACGSDSTAPSPITGLWDYSVSDATDGVVTCDITGVVLDLTQDGRSVVGEASGGSVSCSAVEGGTIPPDFLPPGVLRGGLLGSFIGGHIDLDGLDIDYKHTGSLTGFTLAGPVVITDEVPDGVRELVGTYSAVKR
ncbi:MAG TPA: hypothetical protein VFG84_05850 [Gemmatimonadaceae bacterium]|nr:hypothetical protein [Gemmatimonadaceae bacterium]